MRKLLPDVYGSSGKKRRSDGSPAFWASRDDEPLYTCVGLELHHILDGQVSFEPVDSSHLVITV